MGIGESKGGIVGVGAPRTGERAIAASTNEEEATLILNNEKLELGVGTGDGSGKFGWE